MINMIILKKKIFKLHFNKFENIQFIFSFIQPYKSRFQIRHLKLKFEFFKLMEAPNILIYSQFLHNIVIIY